MSTAANSLLALYRAGGPNEPAVVKAAKAAEEQPETRRRLEAQQAFDTSLGKTIQAIALPEELRQRLTPAADAKPERVAITGPALWAAIFGIIILVGLVVLFVMDRQNKFSGREAIERMVSTAEEMSGDELDPVNVPVGQLADTFMLRGFDMFSVPQELAAAPALGLRVFKQGGGSVAQVAVEWKESLLYVFRPSDIGVELPQGNSWRYLQVGPWAAAVRRQGNMAVALSFRGDDSDMRSFIETLGQPTQP